MCVLCVCVCVCVCAVYSRCVRVDYFSSVFCLQVIICDIIIIKSLLLIFSSSASLLFIMQVQVYKHSLLLEALSQWVYCL